MALGNALAGNKFRVLIATAAVPATFVPLGLMNTFEISSTENTAEFDTFDSDDPIVFPGKTRRSITFSGFLGDADSGQEMVFDAVAAKTNVILKMLWDITTNGFTQECTVMAYKGTARAGNTPVDVSFDFKPTTAAGTLVGAGPLL
jgi:hypothetical protein